jgi:hypothetical protein
VIDVCANELTKILFVNRMNMDLLFTSSCDIATVRLTSIDHPQIEGAYLGIARCEFHFSCLRLGLC